MRAHNRNAPGFSEKSATAYRTIQSSDAVAAAEMPASLLKASSSHLHGSSTETSTTYRITFRDRTTPAKSATCQSWLVTPSRPVESLAALGYDVAKVTHCFPSV